MIHVQKPKAEVEKTAIEVIEMVCKEKGLLFQLAFKGPSKTGNTTIYSNQWKVIVMGQTFRDEDFLKCIGKAMKLVHNALYKRKQ